MTKYGMSWPVLAGLSALSSPHFIKLSQHVAWQDHVRQRNTIGMRPKHPDFLLRLDSAHFSWHCHTLQLETRQRAQLDILHRTAD